MKKKKILASLLAACLFVGLAVPTLATETTALVSDETELIAALANTDITEITFENDITATQTIIIDGDVTINGAGKKLLVTDGLSGGYAIIIQKCDDAVTPPYPSVKQENGANINNLTIVSNNAAMKYPLQIYRSNGVILDDVTLDRGTSTAGGAALLVNASHVEIKNELNLVTTDSAWYSVGLSNGAAPVESNETAKITFVDGASIVCSDTSLSAIQIDQADISKCSVVGYEAILNKSTASNGNEVYEVKPEPPTITFGSFVGTPSIQTKYTEDANGKVTGFVPANHGYIDVTVTKGAEAYTNVLFQIAANSDKIQLIAVDSNGNYYNVVTTKEWGPSVGFPLNTATTRFYIVASEAGKYSATVKLVDVSDSKKELASATTELTVADPKPTPKPDPKPDPTPPYYGGGYYSPPANTTPDMGGSGASVYIPDEITNVSSPSLSVLEVPKGSKTMTDLTTIAPNFTVLKAFNIDLYDGSSRVTVIEGGRVRIDLPFAGKYGTEYVVLRYNDNNTVTQLPATYSNDVISFETNHFSTFAIAVKSNTTVAPPPTTVTQPTTPPATGTAAPFFTVVILVALAGALVLLRKELNRN